MKRLWTILILLLCFFRLEAQNSSCAYDGECVTGFSGRIISFCNNDLPQIIDPGISYFGFNLGYSSIADKQGKLAVSCGGYLIYNGIGDTIWNGRQLNYSRIRYRDQGSSRWTENSIILPKDNEEYYVFTTTMSDGAWQDWDNGFNFRFDMLTYHIVDMKENNGLGKVVKRNQILMQDAYLSHNRMTAVKHANGRDWWLIKPHQTKALFYKFLVTSNGIEGPFEQTLNFPELPEISGLYGQSTFNRTGDKYAYCSGTSYGVYVLNFDRCNGDFRPYHFYPIARDTSYSYDYMIGTCFSPDGKLLYANTSYQIYQMELSDTSQSSIQLIHGPDDTTNAFAEYANINLGPDDRLYIGNLNGVRNTISYINQPNKRGQNCDFCNQCLAVGNGNAKGLPNMPYYHLGALRGSACDTIGKLQFENIKLYPNPVSSELKVYLPLDYNSEVSTALYTISGQRLMSFNSNLNYRQEYSFDMSSLAKGIYLLRIESDGQVWKEKVVKE